jgi:hypothetical protein
VVVRKVLFVVFALALLSVGGVALARSSAASPCNAAALSGTFREIPNSAGAGNITYRLTLTNMSHASCFVTGIPSGTLLDKQGKALPTHAYALSPGTALAAKIELAPGASATAESRFSPDVPGDGEQHPGLCERPRTGSP